MVLFFYFFLFIGAHAYIDIVIPEHKTVFNNNLYEEVLDEELCQAQMQYLINNNTGVLLRFLDAGFRTPKGLLEGNLVDLGNYYQCLNIKHEAPSTASFIEGKFCTIRLPLAQDIELPSLPELPDLPNVTWPNVTWPNIPLPELTFATSRLNIDIKERMEVYGKLQRSAQIVLGGGDRVAPDSPLGGLTVTLAVCIPKTCTTQQAISELLSNTLENALAYDDQYCRLPNDKRWVPVDYVAISLLSFLLLVVIASTGYDVLQTVIRGNGKEEDQNGEDANEVINSDEAADENEKVVDENLLKEDPKRVNKIYQSFSVFTNTRRLLTYTPVPGAIECLDGVRSFAMMWVIIGHTYVNEVSSMLANPLEVVNWIMTPQAIWVTMGPITVDTFFMISGLLLVYTTAGKLSRSRLLMNLHMFYLNRLLRMFPVLATYVLIQASILNRISDGPNWSVIVSQTENCRAYWWSTLLHVQNWVNPTGMCLAHSWYLAIDVQLYILSPLILFWVLGNRKRAAWIALASSLILTLAGASVYNFIMEYQAGPIIPSRDQASQQDYLTNYYVNTLTRASPFLVGMIYGYVLHLYRHERLRMSTVQAGILWTCAVTIFAFITWISYEIMQIDWDNQTVDSLVNSYMRPCWALAVGWIIFACHNGYGGPINWVLTLQCFKVLGRLSYAMYIVHYPLIFLVNSSRIAPGYFSPIALLFKFLADFSLATIVAYLLTLLVDSPFSTLIKHFLGGGQRKPRPAPATDLNGVNGRNGIYNNAYVSDETKKSAL